NQFIVFSERIVFGCRRNHYNHIRYSCFMASSVICASNSAIFFCCKATKRSICSRSQFLFMKRSVIYTLMKCKIKRNSQTVINQIYQFEFGLKLKIFVETKINKLTKNNRTK